MLTFWKELVGRCTDIPVRQAQMGNGPQDRRRLSGCYASKGEAISFVQWLFALAPSKTGRNFKKEKEKKKKEGKILLIALYALTTIPILSQMPAWESVNVEQISQDDRTTWPSSRFAL